MLKIIKKRINKGIFRHIKNYEIDIIELKKRQYGGAEIIDVRNNREYSESHIEGSINIPEYEINSSFIKIIKEKDKEIILYCSSGYRSEKAYKKLKKLGYTNVYTLYGGLDDY